MIAFISLGSNLPIWRAGEGLSPVDLVRLAAAYLDQVPQTRLLAASGLYRSAPVGPGRQRPYINAVAAAQTRLSANDLLAALHSIEQALGRTRALAWQARPIDLDLLDYDGDIVSSDGPWRLALNRPWPPHVSAASAVIAQQRALRLPHPRLDQRNFVLQPLAELCPNWVHPISQLTALQLLRQVKGGPLTRLGPLTF
ncbi:MAG: 2-amino-4-hydroxy-6-hydroxymethyldihydropteridine diphosphokinase [Pseudomonadota bacterium]